MHKMDPATLRKALEQVEQALRDHDQWHTELLRAIVCGVPGDRDTFALNAHRHCPFGRWYYGGAATELREKPAFIAVGVQHARLHATAARLLRVAARGAPIPRSYYEDFAASSARLRDKLDGVRDEMRDALRNRDVLTGAFDRVEMLPELRNWFELAKRGVQQCCIVFMDVDHLKEINDRYGHHAGDGVLAGAVRILCRHLRPYDKVFRYGGDEFLISLPGADLATGQGVIRRVRDCFASEPVLVGGDGMSLHASASFGLALLDPDVDVEESIERADQALLLAKTAGRNRAISWDKSVTTGARLRRLVIGEVGR